MSHAIQESTGLPQPAADELEATPRSTLVSEWTPEDVEEFVRSTKLCDACQVIFGPKHLWTVVAGQEVEEDWRKEYQHHTSHESLLHALDIGCHLCTMLQREMSRTSSGIPESFVKSSFSPYMWFSYIYFDSIMECSSRSIRFDKFSYAQPFIIPCSQRKDHSAIAQYWSKTCQSEHQGCERYRLQPRIKPTRLLYLNPASPESVQLITTHDANHYMYVTLSHRWGLDPHEPPKLSSRHTRGNGDRFEWISIDEMKAGITQSSLPRTFRDALHIARRCKIEYIWIDCLCIVQDKDQAGNNPDWDTEAGKMGDVYAGGLFNIAAVDARHSHEGLLPKKGESPLFAVSDSQNHLPGASETLILYEKSDNTFRRDVVESGLLSRGWVYQEILLTPANLFCTNSQMWWSCMDASRSQTFPLHSINSPVDRGRFKDDIQVIKDGFMARKKDQQPASSWAQTLSAYATTSVSFGDDRLVALKGVSDLLRSLYPDQLQEADYHSGLWSTDALQQLMWRRRGRRPHARATTKYPIPSWSPLKDAGHIEFQLAPALPNKLISMNTSHLDEFGRASNLEGCQVHLQGVLHDIRMDDPLLPESRMAFMTGHRGVRISTYWDNKEETTLARSASGDGHRALLLSIEARDDIWIKGILLRVPNDQEALQPQQHGSWWVRCGWFWNTYYTEDPSKDDLTELEPHFQGDAHYMQRKMIKIEEVFQIAKKYGLRLELENPEEEREKWRWRRRYLHEPELEDIYIV